MTNTLSLSHLAAAACLFGLLGAPLESGAATTQIDPSTLKNPVCSSLFTFNKDKGICESSDEKTKGQTEAPRCSAQAANLSYDSKTKTCVMTVGTPSSAPGNYLGDCFKINSVPEGSGLSAHETYVVTEQRLVDGSESDKSLTLVEGKLSHWPLPGTWGCKVTKNKPPITVNASALARAGANREGWAYGALVMPYKYYPGAKEFVSGLPIGAYLGWRLGQTGAGWTLATALTLSQVKANTVDPKDKDAAGAAKVTGTTDAAALSGALGLVFDVNKSGAGKAFKAGMFVGKDRVNESDTVKYRFNGKTWVAVQLGFDFTDF